MAVCSTGKNTSLARLKHDGFNSINLKKGLEKLIGTFESFGTSTVCHKLFSMV